MADIGHENSQEADHARLEGREIAEKGCNKGGEQGEQEDLRRGGRPVKVAQLGEHGNQCAVTLGPHIKSPITAVPVIPPRMSGDDLGGRLKAPFAFFDEEIAFSDAKINVFSATGLGKPNIVSDFILVAPSNEIGSNAPRKVIGELRGNVPEICDASQVDSRLEYGVSRRENRGTDKPCAVGIPADGFLGFD